MVERFKAGGLKLPDVSKASLGSNPSLSASFINGELAEFGLMQHIANVSMVKHPKVQILYSPPVLNRT